jgi:hypothetical protein
MQRNRHESGINQSLKNKRNKFEFTDMEVGEFGQETKY